MIYPQLSQHRWPSATAEYIYVVIINTMGEVSESA